MSAALAPAARAAQGPHRRELVRAVQGVARTVDALAAEREDLVPLTQRVHRTSAALAVDAGAPLDAALEELPPALAALNRRRAGGRGGDPAAGRVRLERGDQLARGRSRARCAPRRRC